MSDLHGNKSRYQKLFTKIIEEKPTAVFIGGDLLPSGQINFNNSTENFIKDVLLNGFSNLKKTLKTNYPRIFIILGNDDGCGEEKTFIAAEKEGFWEYIHYKKKKLGAYSVYGYACVPPTPFLLKDWERYDVSRYVDPGCIPPEEGFHTLKVNPDDIIYNTIQKDIDKLTGKDDLSKSIFLFHSPPYQTKLDRADLDNKFYNHVPFDVHTGSIAIKNFIELRQPLITLHGHIHESPRLTGSWKDKIKKTTLFSASHDGPELALIKFDPENIKKTTRELL